MHGSRIRASVIALSLGVIAWSGNRLELAAVDDQANTVERIPLIALLVDTSDGTSKAMHHVRESLVAFIEALPSGSEVMLVTTGRRTQVRVRPTQEYSAIRESARQLTADGGPTPLMDALLDIDSRFMRGAKTRWPIFVILTGDGSERSKDPEARKFNEWLQQLSRRDVTGYAVVLKNANGMAETVANAVVMATRGGRTDTTGTSSQLANRMTKVAEAIGRDFEDGRFK